MQHSKQWMVGIGAVVVGAAAVAFSLISGTMLPAGVVAGAGLGATAARLLNRPAAGHAPRRADHAAARDGLLNVLVTMGDLLRAMSPDQLGARGWDQAEFAGVLRRVERLTPALQSALIDYLSAAQPPVDCLEALLAVDRLSAAYTYWTRLFPPRQGGESMFVLSLLHDLSEKVEHAITLVQASRPRA